MDSLILIRQMTVDTLDAPMRTGMRPSLEFGFHDMAARAEIGGAGFGQNLRRSKEEEDGRCGAGEQKQGRDHQRLFHFHSPPL
ncbi:hypothetical protein D3C83_172780 [compost metagenome]